MEGTALATETLHAPRAARPWRLLRLLWRSKSVAAGALICVAFLFMAIAAPLIAPHDPLEQSLTERFQRPSAEYPLGTDEFGRDVLSRLLWGSRISLAVGVLSVALALLAGVPLGLMAGFMGGRVETLLMRLADMMLAFPLLLLAMTLTALLGFSLRNVILAIAAALLPVYVRFVRACTLAVKEQEFVQAAIVVGASDLRIMVRHILPNIVAPVVVLVTFDIATAILVEGGLSFLGLGVPPPRPTWGNVIGDGRAFLRNAPWISTFGGLAITLAVLGLNLLGDGLRNVLDPVTRSR